MYHDEFMKVMYYTEQITREFIKSGVYPGNEIIEEKLSKINKALALYKQQDFLPGKNFDVKKFNYDMNLIYQDLKYLYRIVFVLTKDELLKLQDYVDAHLDYLEDIASLHKKKAIQETNSTALGQTLLFKHSSFNIKKEDTIDTIDLGIISLANATKLACFANINNIEAKNAVFVFKNGIDQLYVSPYNYNQDALVIPGEKQITSYNFNLHPDQVINGPVELNLNGIKPNANNKYIVLAGKDKIQVRDEDNNSLVDKPTTLSLENTKKKTLINFYVLDGNKITFKFNKKPLSTNFSLDDYKVTNLDHIHHFFIEGDENFTFSFELDKGSVYAVKETGLVDRDKLYFQQALDVKDFLIQEYKTGDKKDYNVYVRLYNDSGIKASIDSILIKEVEV